MVGCGNLMQGSDFPDDLPGKKQLYPDAEEWVNQGDSLVVAPGGAIVAGPLHKESGILYCDIDLGKIDSARRVLDVAGHYFRPDIFTLQVNRKSLSSVEFKD